MSTSTSSKQELKQRVLTCLDRLGDRDTLPQASAELELIARSLSPQTSLSTFLSCLLSLDSSKPAVRLHSLLLISSLAASHGPHLAPHVPKIISSSLLRRIRDPDTAVRSACSQASSALARHVSSSPLNAILDPLFAVLFVDQDYNVQIGAAMCLSAAIDSTSHPLDSPDLRRLLPKMLKLARSDGFRAKPALLALIRSVLAADGVINGPALMANVVTCAVELLASDDWATRKAAAELLHEAASHTRLVVEVKTMCLNALDKRKFDKVKIAREAMSRALEAWKAVNDVSLEDPPFFHSNSSSSKDKSNAMCPSPVSTDDQSFGFQTPEPKKNWANNRPSMSDCSTVTSSTTSSNRSGNGCSEAPRLDTTLSKRSSVSSLSDDSAAGLDKKDSLQSASGNKGSCHQLRKSHVRKPLDPEIDVWGTLEDDTHVGYEFEQRKSEPVDSVAISCGSIDSSTQKTFNNSLYEDLRRNPVNRRFRSRVVPSRDVYDSPNFDGGMIDGHSADFGDISLIHKHLIQIERQQANLMEIVQKFMGTSRSGINSLETRVSGLEKALDGISYNLATQAGGRISNETARTPCCNIRGAEFLTTKFWRKNESDHFAASNTSWSGTVHSLPYMDSNVNARLEFTRDLSSSSRTVTKSEKEFQ